MFQNMAKSFKCADVGKDCDWSAHADTESELMQQIAEHANHVHNITEIPDDLKAKVTASIKDE